MKSSTKWNILIFQILHLYSILSSRRKRQYFYLILITILSAISELISLGSVFPFLHVISNPETLNDPNSTAYKFLSFFPEFLRSQGIFLLGAVFGLAALLAGIVRSFSIWFGAHLSFKTGVDLNKILISKFLNEEYLVQISRNTSEPTNIITNKVNIVVGNILFPSFLIFSSTTIFFSILLTLLYVDFYSSLIAAVGFGLIYSLILIATSSRKKINSNYIASESTSILKILGETFGNIRDVKMSVAESFFSKQLISHDEKLKRSQASNIFLSQFPRFGMEAIGLIFIVCLALFMLSTNSNNLVIPTLGILALGAQRILPVMQQIYVSLSMIEAGQASLRDILDQNLESDFLEVEDCKDQKLNFENEIFLKVDNFSYKDDKSNLINSEIIIKQGDIIGIKGETGSGKTTLVDILMGLLFPNVGILKVDGVEVNQNNVNLWRKMISHVPQNIFLSDASIKDNITFGELNEFDLNQFKRVIELSELDNFIEQSPNKENTLIGERGLSISGGQIQRIAIARALYNNRELLILDEATSALDTQTEKKILKNIIEKTSYKAIVMIAHRLSTLNSCNKIIEVKNKSTKIFFNERK